jgi:ATP-binding cassette, subfamily B (MDR/TAP), member 1
MGEGVVLEHGTHDELLGREDSAYSRLVRAQNLRGGAYTRAEPAANRSTPNAGLEEGSDDKLIGRARAGTFSSETHGHALKEATKEKDSVYSVFFLSRRMANLNRDSVWDYVAGLLVSIRGIVLFLF